MTVDLYTALSRLLGQLDGTGEGMLILDTMSEEINVLTVEHPA